MRKLSLVFVIILVLFGSMFTTSCAPNKWYLVNSEGILTYNRHTGQLELVWSHHSEMAKADSIKTPVDSVISNR